MTLGLYNTVALAATTPVQLSPPGTGHYYLNIWNDGPGDLFVSNVNTAGANATSFKIGPALLMPPIPVFGPSGVWVASDQAGAISVALLPR